MQSRNLSIHANATLNTYYGEDSSFYHNLTSLISQVLALNSSLSLGLPTSQQSVETFLGSR